MRISPHLASGNFRMARSCASADNSAMSPEDAERLRTALRAAIKKSDHWDATSLSVKILERGKDYLRDFLAGRKESIGASELTDLEDALQLPPLLGAREITRVPIEEFERDHIPDENREIGVSTIEPYKGSIPGAIPDLEASGGAGPGENSRLISTARGAVTYSADAVRGEIVLPQYLLNEYTKTPAARIHSIRVRGDSMEATLKSGDRVFADTNDKAIGQGGVFVILDHRFDEVLVKRLRRLDGGRQIVIRSDNPSEGDSEPVDAEDITIIGRAVARLTRI